MVSYTYYRIFSFLTELHHIYCIALYKFLSMWCASLDSGCDDHPSESLHLSRKSTTVKNVCSPCEVHGNNTVESDNMLEQSKYASEAQKGHFLKMKPELEKLCEALNLPVCISFSMFSY